jgi:putative two-component system response regulator
MRNQSPHESSLPGVPELIGFRQARILIVDDEAANVELLRRLLARAGFTRIDSTIDPREAAPMFERLRPDLVLLDLHMPHMSGLQVIDELNGLGDATYLPILMLTGDMTPEARREALSRGAKDFVNKPFHADEVLLRIRTLLETRFLYLQIQSQNQMLEAKVQERTQELEAAQIEILERLARAAEFRDDKTGQHTERVGQMAALLAQELGLPDPLVALIRRAAPLHDVGKIGIPDVVLLKLGKLTDEEFTLIKTHTTIGTAPATRASPATPSRSPAASSPLPTCSTRSPRRARTRRRGRLATRWRRSSASAAASSTRPSSTRSCG